MSALRRSGPPHAMCEPRGGQPDLRIAQPFPDFAEDIGIGDDETVQRNHRMTAGKRTVECIEHTFDDDLVAIHIAKKHLRARLGHRHDDCETPARPTGDPPLPAPEGPPPPPAFGPPLPS